MKAEPDVVAMLAGEFAGNEWFLREFWPANAPRITMILRDLAMRCPPGPGKAAFDIGCYNGFLSVLLRLMGYGVAATDAVEFPEQQERLERLGVEFFRSNFNEPEPFRSVEDASMDVAVLGEVLEHVLNHPVGFLGEIARVLRPGGTLVLTTPNPATLANAIRMIRGTFSLWGTREFASLEKCAPGGVIDHGTIHYREYLQAELREMLATAGFSVLEARYVAFGPNRTDPLVKRLAKRGFMRRDGATTRLAGASHYLVCTKSEVASATGA